ncbi:MAG: LAGLIDADG family homing endonuclease [Candidatus Aenigmarchaeota archaeon]|nr:LAGLIDADG family homing endonuclease [Candidatus Aenigmarchaeota archaeon]
MNPEILYSRNVNMNMKFYLPRVYKRGPAPTMILNSKIKKLVDISDCKDFSKMPTFILTELYLKREFPQQKIANLFGVQHETICRWLKRLKLPIRSQGDAVSMAITRHRKTPFSKNLEEKAYLIGLRTGDISAQKHGRNIRAHISSTHPSMIELFRELFEKYGKVGIYPKKYKNSKIYPWKYSWKTYCDLDKTFDFLLKKTEKIPKWIMNDNKIFFSFLSGYFDAEGCFSISHKKGKGSRIQWIIRSCDKEILENITKMLKNNNFNPHFKLTKKADGISYKKDYWSVELGDRNQILNLMRLMTVRHKEKVDKIDLALDFVKNNWENASERIIELRQNIKKDVREFVKSAEKDFLRRKNNSNVI